MTKNFFHVNEKSRVAFDDFKNFIDDLYLQNHIQNHVLVQLNNISKFFVFENTLKKRLKN